jgi:SAM-dependent methyltransferase
MTDAAQNEQLREEFNRWAEAGRGEGMEREHLPIVLPMLAQMNLRAEENVIDLGCGSGWLVKLIATRVTEGRVVGMDISDEMVRLARKATIEQHNVMCITGSVDEIPWQPNFFSRAVSVESSYYWPDPAHGIKEIFRVLADGGSAWILINYYRDNPFCERWGALLKVPAKLLSAEEWSGFFRDAGFTGVQDSRIPDPTPKPAEYKGKWFRDADELGAFRKIGALLIRGTK